MPSVLKDGNFRLLWGGQAISQTGDSVCSIAALFTVMELTGNSALGIAGITACNQVPALAVGLWAGVFVDRWGYQRSMIGSDFVRLVLSLALVLFAATKWLPGIYISMVFMGAAAQFFTPARIALLPDVVPEGQLLAANSLASTTAMVLLTLGAALGGTLYTFVGAAFCFALNAATFLVSALSIMAIRAPRKDASATPASWEHLVTEWKAGYRYIGQRQPLRSLFIGVFTAVLGFGVINVLGPKFVTDELRLAKSYYAAHSLFLGAGAALASAGLAAASGRLKPVLLFSSSLLLIGLCFASLLIPTGLLALAAVVFVIGIGNVGMNSGLSTILQSRVAKEYRGRVFGIIGPVITAATLLSAALGALFAEPLGLRGVFGAAGVLVLTAGLYVRQRLGDEAGREGDARAA